MSLYCRLLSVFVAVAFTLSVVIYGWLLAVPAAGVVVLLDVLARIGDHHDRD